MALRINNQALLLLTIFLFFLTKANGGIAVYWGQRSKDEGSLKSTCESGKYEIVLLAFLSLFGCGRIPAWNFSKHCGGWDPCTKLQHEIEYCQQKGVKVFLSLGGDYDSYSLCPPQDAKDLAKYLYDNFLSGDQYYGPLGSVSLDGIDLHIQNGSNLYYDDLVKELDTLRYKKRYFYLSAAPGCSIPDFYLHKAIKTGLLNYVFVKFYNNLSCQYSSDSNLGLLFKSVTDWNNLILPNNSFFFGLPAAPDAAPGGGYITSLSLVFFTLPTVKQASNYGGVMLWDRARDVRTGYSDFIAPFDPKYERFVKAIYEGVSAVLDYTILPNKLNPIIN